MAQYTLAASAARTAGASGTGVLVGGYPRNCLLVLSVTNSDTDAGDTLDVHVDVSPDGTAWIPVAHFAQQAGDGAAKTEVAVLSQANPGTSTVAVTSDAAAGAVRPSVWGKYMRARWAIADSGDGNSSHTFSVDAYC
ncbi:MAG: hypothetical protein M0R22_13810 [Dehalococcoidia bacterium]|jgi:hypothetical protein|nr:hypothetical protein [Dehalococcoidia bacterium]